MTAPTSRLAAYQKRKQAHRSSLGDFLAASPWSFFVTLTFKQPISVDTAKILFDRWSRMVGQRAKVCVTWFRSNEVGAKGGRLHFHVLIGNADHLSPADLTDSWQHGRATASRYSPEGKAAYYVSKDIDGEEADYDISKPCGAGARAA